MRRTTTVGGVVLLGLGLASGACVARGDDSGQPSRASAPDSAGAIEVARDSQVSLRLRGGLGPIVEGQTVTKAMVSLQDVELVGADGTPVPLLSNGVTTDLVGLENSLQSLVDEQTVAAGHYTDLRFRLTSAWIETVDAQSVTRVFASQGVDPSQFGSESVSRLDLGGLGPDGLLSVALPQSGIALQGSASLALHFALAESLSLQDGGTWLLSPRVWAVDASQFSSLDVDFAISSESESQYLTQGFQVMLFDANRYPVCEAPLTVVSSTVLAASFQYVESFQGPFVAVLVPPSGVSLDSDVAVSVDVRQSVHVETSIDVSSVQERGAGRFDVRCGDQARVTERTRQGQVVDQRQQRVGSIDDVTPHMAPSEPLRPGEKPPRAAPTPKIPGLPGGEGNVPLTNGGAPSTTPEPMPEPMPGERGRGRPSGEDAGRMPSGRDTGPMPPSFGAGGDTRQFDAGVRQPAPSGPVPPPPRYDAGAPTTGIGERGPSRGAGAPPAASVPREPTDTPPAASIPREPTDMPPPASVPREPTDMPPATSAPRQPTDMPPPASVPREPTNTPPAASVPREPTNTSPAASVPREPTDTPPPGRTEGLPSSGSADAGAPAPRTSGRRGGAGENSE